MIPVKRTLAPLTVLLLLTGCAGGEPEATATETVTATPEPAPSVTETATPEPAPTVTETVTATPEPEETEAPAEDDGDRTDEVREIAGDMVTEAIESEPGRFTISTMLIDPRGDDDSPAAQEALAICEAVELELGATHVSVMESDDTTFVLLGNSSPECTEF